MLAVLARETENGMRAGKRKKEEKGKDPSISVVSLENDGPPPVDTGHVDNRDCVGNYTVPVEGIIKKGRKRERGEEGKEGKRKKEGRKRKREEKKKINHSTVQRILSLNLQC
jgi:hypothetical protein